MQSRDSKRSVVLIVHFTLNTGAPTTELSPTAMARVLGFWCPWRTCLKELTCWSQRKYCSHKDVSVLGQDFCRLIMARVVVDYSELTCELIRQSTTAPSHQVAVRV